MKGLEVEFNPYHHRAICPNCSYESASDGVRIFCINCGKSGKSKVTQDNHDPED